MMSRTIAQLASWWQAERSRRLLWLPVCFGAGVGAYYHLPVEPALYVLPLLLVLALGALMMAPVSLAARWALLFIVAGALWANIHTGWREQTVLARPVEPRPMVGIVEEIVRTEHGVRLTLGHVTVNDLAAAQTPERVRLAIRLKKGTDPELPGIGDAISITAGLRPPMGPALPHGFDFARYFYFRDIGAVGYGLPPWKVVAQGKEPGIAADFSNWRVAITERILKTLGPETGGVAAGLITGDARAIRDADFTTLKASNLYHIIAISGEHMMVIAGVIFISLRLLALLLPGRLAFRPAIKPMAAVVTLGLVTAYLFVTGLPVSAVRAYVMIVLVLLAVMLRRQVDPVRSLATTALLMLIADPANLLDPGFQLSFAATLAILSLVESALRNPPEGNWWLYGLHLFSAMLLVSVVAEAATAPLVIAQFNTISPYGVMANMIATPLVSLFLMPTVALYFILLPLGLEHWALGLMDIGIRGLLGLAHWIAGFPGSQVFLPSIPGWGIALFVLGLSWVCLWRTRGRLAGLVLIVIGVGSIVTNRPPDMLIGEQLTQIALRTPEGYALARGRASSMVPELWANGSGYRELPKAEAPAWRCDKLGCVATVEERRLAFPIDAVALLDDCTQAQFVFTRFEGARCDGAAVYGPREMQGRHVMALWFDGSETRIESSGDWQGKRPWSVATFEEVN